MRATFFLTANFARNLGENRYRFSFFDYIYWYGLIREKDSHNLSYLFYNLNRFLVILFGFIKNCKLVSLNPPNQQKKEITL